MGILKNFEGEGLENEHVNAVAHVDSLINADHFSDSSSSSEDEEVVVPQSTLSVSPPAPDSTVPAVANRTPKVKKLVSKIPKPILHVKNIGGTKSQGNRQARRHENMCFLLNLAKDLDEDFAEVNMNELVETTVSAFAQLLLSKNKMKIWNEFVELPERQQERIVKLATDKKSTKKIREEKNKKRYHQGTATAASCSSEEGFDTFVLIESRTTTTTDQPMADPLRRQEEAEACFRRIDSNIRYTLKSMVKRHHSPVERLSWFEEDLIPFVSEHPDSVYLRDLNNGFDRMLLHGVCQYLNLTSKSFTRDGERYTQVENRRVEFLPPTILLSEYIKDLEGLNQTDS